MLERTRPEGGVSGLEKKPRGIFEITDHLWTEISFPRRLALTLMPREETEHIAEHRGSHVFWFVELRARPFGKLTFPYPRRIRHEDCETEKASSEIGEQFLIETTRPYSSFSPKTSVS